MAGCMCSLFLHYDFVTRHVLYTDLYIFPLWPRTWRAACVRGTTPERVATSACLYDPLSLGMMQLWLKETQASLSIPLSPYYNDLIRPKFKLNSPIFATIIKIILLIIYRHMIIFVCYFALPRIWTIFFLKSLSTCRFHNLWETDIPTDCNSAPKGWGHKNIIDDQRFYATFHKMWESLAYQASFNEDIDTSFVRITLSVIIKIWIW